MTSLKDNPVGNANRWSDDEWTARRELAASHRLIAHFGMDDLAFTHISLEVPGTRGQFLISPFGTLFHEVTASMLLKVDVDGKLLEPSPFGVNQAGFVIHSAIHMSREDAKCVLHTHTVAGMAVSCLADGLLPLSQWALMLKDDIGYHDLEGIAFDTAERASLVTDIAQHKALILRNHGLLTVGRTAAEAFHRMYYLEQSCRVQLAALSSGAKLWWPREDVQTKMRHQFMDISEHAPHNGCIEWDGLLRLLDQKDRSYRD
jgi:ribulose-5-phosphate 4-epimerase/fuculose-1-phosphate aldolase